MSDPAVFPRAPRRGAENVAEPMRSRWSPTLFDPEHVVRDHEVAELLAAAQWAPSWGNSQPWHWMVCQRGTPSFEHLVATLTRGNLVWVPRVSVVFVSVVQQDVVDGHEPSPYASYDAGQAAAHLTLQARAMGLHAHQFAGFDHEDFGLRLGVPSTYRVLAGVAVGAIGDPALIEAPEAIVAKDHKPRVRRTLAEQAFVGSWGQPWGGAADKADTGEQA